MMLPCMQARGMDDVVYFVNRLPSFNSQQLCLDAFSLQRRRKQFGAFNLCTCAKPKVKTQ